MYILPFKKPQWVDLGESDAKSVGQRRLKMAYEYVRVKQVFSVARYPRKYWSYPVYLLMKVRATDSVGDFVLSDIEDHREAIELVPGVEY